MRTALRRLTASALQRLGMMAVWLLGLAVTVQAHPHVWVTVETTVVYDKGAIIGLQQKWTFDELYTAMAIEGLDKNNDGTYARAELAELAKVNVESLKEFGYFTVVRLAGQPLKVDEPRDYWLEHALPPKLPAASADGKDAADGAAGSDKAPAKKSTMDRFWGWMAGDPAADARDRKDGPPAKVLSLHFFLPLEKPVLSEAEGFSFEVSDPTFFIAFSLAAFEPVKIGEGAPAGCRATVQSAMADDGRRLGEGNIAIPEGGFAVISSKSISVSCKAAP